MSLTVWQEHRFWLQILYEHALFVYENLSPGETEAVTQACAFMHEFCELLSELSGMDPHAPVHAPTNVGFAQRAYAVASRYCQFEEGLQKRRINNEVVLSLSPSYFNGTLLEAKEYIRLLSYYVKGIQPPHLPLLSLLNTWLIDQLGHSILLINMLDPLETIVATRSERFRNLFRSLLSQAQSMAMFPYSESEIYPRLALLGHETADVVKRFYRYVETVTRLYRKRQVLNKTTLRFLEHHFSETNYFLIKLSYYFPDIQPLPDGGRLYQSEDDEGRPHSRDAKK
ncbi:DUF2935 family protein [Laceyella sacchari]|uniref:DUF2935 domain-containing protein n=1 Tax=Laceyella sacchari TaxID=37482 RepID=UPI00104F4329|nr:DUF2935 domain-containing protein [Laceyella sacchari]TCW41433.1 DUF2935 family protein [Laceyella sacchari]